MSILYLLFIFLTFSVLFLLSSFLCVYCLAPIYQGKFLVCENLLGNKPDSDFALGPPKQINLAMPA